MPRSYRQDPLLPKALGPSEMRLYRAMARAADQETGLIDVSLVELGQRLGVSTMRASQLRRKLVEKNVIQQVGGRRGLSNAGGSRPTLFRLGGSR